MKLPREDLEEAVAKSKRVEAAKLILEVLQRKIDEALGVKSEHINKISECNTDIRRLQGEIRKLGVLCQGINRRIGVYQGKMKQKQVSIKKEQKRIEQKLEDEWVEMKRQEFRKSCYVKNLNI
jgi:hypothetical protein